MNFLHFPLTPTAVSIGKGHGRHDGTLLGNLMPFEIKALLLPMTETEWNVCSASFVDRSA
jgi:hypothetical protein